MSNIKFNWVDVVFVILLFRMGYLGLKSGFLFEIFRFFGLLAAFLFSFNNYVLLSRLIVGHINWDTERLDLVSFLVIFLGVLLIFKILLGLARLASKIEDVSGISRVLGLLLGLSRGILLVGLLYTLFVNSHFEYLAESAEEKSYSSQYISKVLPFVYKTGMRFYPWQKFETPFVKAL